METDMMRRYKQLGAVFADSLSDLSKLRSGEYQSSAMPTLVNDIERGKCIYFDSAAWEKLAQPGAGLLNNITTNMTTCCWIKKEGSNSSYPHVLSRRDAENTGWVFYINHPANTLALQVVDGAFKTEESVESITESEWAHVSINYDAGDVVFYINGIPEDTQTGVLPSSILYTTKQFSIAGETGSSHIKAYLKDVLIFPFSLTDEDVTHVYNDSVFNYDANLTHHWDLSQVEPIDLVTGAQANGISLTTSNMIEGQNSNTRATYFDGTNDYVKTTSVLSGLVINEDSLTFSIWVNVDNTTGTRESIFSETAYSSNDEGIIMNIKHGDSSGRLRFQLGEQGGSIAVAADNSFPMKKGEWNHLVGVIDATNKKVCLYVNGVLLGDASTSSLSGVMSPSTPQLFTIGAYSNGGGFKLDGKLNDLRIYNTALSQLQIKDLYQRTK